MVYIFLNFTGLELEMRSKDQTKTLTIIVGAVSSVTFLTVGFLLGVLCVYLILRVRGRSSSTPSPSHRPRPPSIPLPNPPKSNVEVVTVRDRKLSTEVPQQVPADYEPVITSETTVTSPNATYEQLYY